MRAFTLERSPDLEFVRIKPDLYRFGLQTLDVDATLAAFQMNPPGMAQGHSDAVQPVTPQEHPSTSPQSGASSANTPAVPDYELLRRIGHGAYGDVWLARSKATGALRAAKIVWRNRFEDERPYRREFEGIQRFEQISREHPSQLALFHIGRNDAEGYFYYVMELADSVEVGGQSTEVRKVQGAGTPFPASDIRPLTSDYTPRTLRAELGQGRLPAGRVLEIGLALTEALAHLHQHGLVHRDVKPSNVIFVNGRPKLADIGLVTDASDQCSIVGTEGYLPPEGPGTPQADIFALGKVLYEAATGLDRREFPKLPEDIRSWPDAAQILELNEIILKACTAEAGKRFQSAQEMLDDLARLAQGRSVKRHRIWRRRLQTARSVGVAAVTIVLAAAGGIFLWQTAKQRGAPVMLVDEAGDALGLHDAKAAQAYKLGLSALRRGTPMDVGLAQNHFNTVIKIEPTFVNAYARQFETYLQSEDHGGPAIPGKTEMLNKLSAKLQEIAPTNAETHAAIAIVRFLNEWRWKDAEKEFKEALRIDPNCRIALTYYGYFLTRLCRSDAAKYLKRADELYPASADIAKLLGHCDYANRHFEDALNHYLDAEERERGYASAYYWAGRANMVGVTNYFEAFRQLHKNEVLLGYDEASNAARYDKYRKAVEKNPDDPGRAFWSALIEELKPQETNTSTPYAFAARYVRVGDKAQALKWLKTAIDQHGDGMENLLFDECWDSYHREKWFQDIVKEVGLDPWL